MPYTKQEFRKVIDKELDEFIDRMDFAYINMSDKDFASVVTYVFFKIVRKYYENGSWYVKADVEKICHSVVTEFERRFMFPYENKKIEENGDVG